jgi:hypothetical protein
VRLVNGETGMVVRRGNAFTAEQVCVLLSPAGEALENYELRDTSAADFGIVAALSDREAKVSVDYARIRQVMDSGAS